MLAIYCRISGKKTEGRDVSIEVQRDTGIKFANEKGYQYKLYVDKGISGAKTEIEERPQFANLIADIKRGIITKVFAYDQSRIVRQAKIWHLFVYELEKKRCQYFENGKLIDLNDTNTKFYTGLLALVDQLYTETTSIKVKAANKANAKKGKGHGITLYGYYKDENGYLKINGDEAKIVKNIFSMSASGIGTYTIANNLNNLGIKPKSSQFKGRYLKKKDNYTNRETLIKRDEIKWSGTTIYGMLRNSSYKGIRKYGNEVIEISPIITEELWDKVNNNLKNIKSGKKSSYNYLLNGLIFCGECNSELRGKIKKERNKTYSCAGKRKKKNCKKSRGINIVKLDSFILKHLFYTKELQNHLSNLNLKKGKNDKLESDINNKSLRK